MNACSSFHQIVSKIVVAFHLCRAFPWAGHITKPGCRSVIFSPYVSQRWTYIYICPDESGVCIGWFCFLKWSMSFSIHHQFCWLISAETHVGQDSSITLVQQLLQISMPHTRHWIKNNSTLLTTMTLEKLLEQTVLHFADCFFRSQKIDRAEICNK